MTIYSTEQTNVRTSETSPHPDKKIICIRTRNIPLKFKLSTNSKLIDNNNKWILWLPDKLRVALLTLGIRVEGPQLGHEDRQVVLDDGVSVHYHLQQQKLCYTLIRSGTVFFIHVYLIPNHH